MMKQNEQAKQEAPVFEQVFHCAACQREVRIRVQPPANPFVVLWYWIRVLGSKCKDCLAVEMRN